MFRKLLLPVMLMTLSLSAHAEWVAGVSYSNISDSDSGVDLDLGTLNGSVGYVINRGDAFSIVPGLRAGFGVSDDNVDVFGIPVDVEITRFIAFEVRGEYRVNDQFYIYAQPAYANMEIEVSGGGASVSDDDWEFGGGIGGGYRFNDKVGAELSWETYDGTDILSLGLRFNF